MSTTGSNFNYASDFTCHGCVYPGSFVLDYHALYLQHFTSTVSIEYTCHIKLFRNGSVHEILSYENVDYFGTNIPSVVGKKSNLNEQNFKVYWKTRMEDGGWRMEGGGLRIRDRRSRIS